MCNVNESGNCWTQFSRSYLFKRRHTNPSHAEEYDCSSIFNSTELGLHVDEISSLSDADAFVYSTSVMIRQNVHIGAEISRGDRLDYVLQRLLLFH